MKILKTINKPKIAVFWVASPCSLVEVSEVLAASIIRAPNDGGSKDL
jgi:hypothetical protein